jgi:hypothetical protein
MAYDIDQCAQCGGVRVAGSTLCADCLIISCANVYAKAKEVFDVRKKERDFWALEIVRKDEEIRELKYQLRIKWKLLQKIFTEYQNLLRLYKRDGMKLEAVNRVFR